MQGLQKPLLYLYNPDRVGKEDLPCLQGAYIIQSNAREVNPEYRDILRELVFKK